jgi:hypothetical protein
MPGGLKAVDVKCSLFQTVIRTSDGSLWMMGIGELDKNNVCNPIPVWRPIPSGLNENLGPNDVAVDDRVYDVCANATGGLLRKGHNRVSILYPPGQSPYSDSSTRGDYYDIVLHKGEAYYLPLQLHCPTQVINPPTHSVGGAHGGFNPTPDPSMVKDVEIIDYFCGLNHSVLLTKP